VTPGAALRLALLLLAAWGAAACDKADAPPPAVPSPPSPSPHAEMVPVPAGPFVLGSDDVDTENRAQEFGSRRPWYEDEHPRQVRTLGDFRIDRTEVTEGAYEVFVATVGYAPPPDWKGLPPKPEDPALPVVNVSWMDAQNFCHWRGARLPTEFEWEKAARGPKGRVYPWGDTFERERANVGQSGEVAAAGHFAGSASPYGALDLAGNVWEWTASWYLPYPGNTVPSPFYGHRFKVLRGGSAGAKGGHYQLEALTARSSYRFFLDPRMQVPDVGFRCVQAVGPDGRPIDDRDAKLHG
jgi:formylglycine-generating enzyme required for sulfatase activity